LTGARSQSWVWACWWWWFDRSEVPELSVSVLVMIWPERGPRAECERAGDDDLTGARSQSWVWACWWWWFDRSEVPELSVSVLWWWFDWSEVQIIRSCFRVPVLIIANCVFSRCASSWNGLTLRYQLTCPGDWPFVKRVKYLDTTLAMSTCSMATFWHRSTSMFLGCMIVMLKDLLGLVTVCTVVVLAMFTWTGETVSAQPTAGQPQAQTGNGQQQFVLC